jgi:hypothetical protein
MLKVFVSHSSEDEALASALVDSIMTSMNIDDTDIRCTSVPGHKLDVGADTATTLRDDLGETAVAVGLVSRHSISSAWVLFELGAVWGARKHLKPLITDDLDYKDLPGPLIGTHVARLSSKSDLVQFIDEIAAITQSNKRTAPKIDAAINKLIGTHAEYMKARPAQKKPKLNAQIVREPSFSGIPYSDLLTTIQGIEINVPPGITGGKGSIKNSLFTLFVSNYESIAGGLQSNWEKDTAGAFLYREVALRLIPFDLVKFEKLPAAQAKWFKRIVLSEAGQSFIAHYLRSKKK